MNQTNNGKNVSEKLEEIEQRIDEYSEQLKLSSITPSEDTAKYINLSREDINKLTADECHEAYYSLCKEALCIQYHANLLKTKINWATSCIDFMVADKLSSYDQYTPSAQKRILAIKENSAALKLQEFITNSQLKYNLIAYLPEQLKNIADSLKEIGRGKRNG